MVSATLFDRPARAPARALILFTMCLGVLVAQIDTSVVNLALTPINADLGAGVGALQWVVDAYNLTYATLLLTGGVLGDLYGRRRLFAVGIALFTVGSVICGLAPNIGALIAGRAVAGLGAALEVPITLAILTVTYPEPEERALPLGIWASCNGLAFIIGPTLGGVLVDHTGWRSIFLLIVPLCLLALGLAYTAVKESSAPQGRHLDLRGQALAILTLGSLSFGVIEGPRWGWTSPLQISMAVVFVVSLIAFLRVEARTEGAMIPLPLFRSRSLSAALAIAALMTFGMYAMLFLTPLYLQSVRGVSALTAGLELLPMSLSFVVVAQLSGWLTNKVGPRVMTVGGMSFMGVGMLMMAFGVTAGGLLPVEAALLVIGVGLGLNTAPVQNVAVASVPQSRAGTASGLVNTARMVGATLGVAVLGVLFALNASGGAAGFRLPYLVGGAGELIGAGLAFWFVSADALKRKKS
ncbi:MAG: MFS transporter [Alphaproteobacteria bacterium]|nr:MFS transporter [Alphaproteobacteria bacterium]